MRIEIISGSPRENSVTHRVALHLADYIKNESDHEVQLLDVREWPLPPIQSVFTSIEKTPAEFKALAERIFHADAFILISPEYNGSYTPALKNLLDHFPKQIHKPFGIVTASPGAMGGIRAALAMQHLVLALFGIASPHMLVIPEVDKKFDETGFTDHEKTKEQIRVFTREYLWLAEKLVEEKITA